MRNFLFFRGALLFGTLMLLATLANGNSNSFEAYAVTTCDTTSTCTNIQTGTGNSQSNNCTDLSTCQNEAHGVGNAQTNRCDSSASPIRMLNSIFGNRNTQVTDCANVGGTGCFNAVGGMEIHRQLIVGIMT